MDNPDNWMWIWLGGAVLFGAGEMAAAGSFFLLPFAVGALITFFAATFGVGLFLQWAIFVVVSTGAFLALRPLARRLDADHPVEGIGSRRLIGESARVIEAISDSGDGMIRLEREEWRAQSLDGQPIPVGTAVRVVEVRGTRVIVFPLDLDPGDTPPPPID
ncbi:MAG: NfeD family protein [Acidimicrobiales bacterium]